MIFTPHRSGSAANLYLVDSEDGSILIEAGLPVSKIKAALGFGLSRIDAALISHSHADHARGVPGLLPAGVDCYMTEETADALAVSGHRVKIIEPLKQFSIGRFAVLPFPTQHDCPGSVGFLISDGAEKLLFATDTFYIRYRFSGVSILAVECNYSLETINPDLPPNVRKRLYSSHFSLENVLKFIESTDLSKCREIHLLHLSNDNSDADLFVKAVQGVSGVPVYVAGEGKV